MKNKHANYFCYQNFCTPILIFVLLFIFQNNIRGQYTSNLVTGNYENPASWNGTAPTTGTVDKALTIISGANITRTGNLINSKSISLDGKLTITGNYSESSWPSLTINATSGELVVNGTFSTQSPLTIDGKLTAGGTVSLNSGQAFTITSNGNATFNSGLTIPSTATISGILNVIGTTQFSNSTTINTGATINITGNFTANSTIIQNGGTLTVTGNTTFNNTVIIKSGSKMEIIGNLNAKDLTVEQGGLLIVHGDIYTSNGLTVSGDVVATGDINAKGLTVNSTGNLVVAGDVFTARGWSNTPTGDSNIYILNPNADVNAPKSTNVSSGYYGDVNSFITNESGNSSLSTIVDNLNILSAVVWYSYSTGDWTSNNWTLDATLSSLDHTTAANKTINPGIADNYVIKSGKTITINSSSNVTTSKITIDANATLTLAAGGKLTTNDIVTNNGTFNLEFTTSQPCSYINKKAISGNNAILKRTFEGGRAWYIGNCIVNVPYSTFVNATPAPTPAANVSLMYSYNTSSKTWVAPSGADQLSLMKGYSVNFGNSGPYTVTQTGSIATGNQSTTIYADGDKWNLLANPFPAYLDFSPSKIAEWNISNIEPSLYVRSRKDGVSTYYTVNLTTGISTPTGLSHLAPMQAFFVKAKNTGDFAINSTARINPTTAPSLKAAQLESDILRLTTSNASASDETVIVFRAIGSETVSSIDSEKKLETAGAAPQLYSIKGQKNIAINIMPDDPSLYTIPLAMTLGAKGAGDITLTATDISSFIPGVDVYLKDLTTGTVTDLRQSPSYTFSSAAVTSQKRFEISFKKSANQSNTTTDIDAISNNVTIRAFAVGKKAVVIVNDNSFNGDVAIDIFDTNGNTISNHKSTTKRTEIMMTGNSSICIVRVTYNNSVKSFKIVSPSKL
jgi:formylmethanofuran dehydrogenase subunit C